jgi:hypothetical protein
VLPRRAIEPVGVVVAWPKAEAFEPAPRCRVPGIGAGDDFVVAASLESVGDDRSRGFARDTSTVYPGIEKTSEFVAQEDRSDDFVVEFDHPRPVNPEVVRYELGRFRMSLAEELQIRPSSRELLEDGDVVWTEWSQAKSRRTQFHLTMMPPSARVTKR